MKVNQFDEADAIDDQAVDDTTSSVAATEIQAVSRGKLTRALSDSAQSLPGPAAPSPYPVVESAANSDMFFDAKARDACVQSQNDGGGDQDDDGYEDDDFYCSAALRGSESPVVNVGKVKAEAQQARKDGSESPDFEFVAAYMPAGLTATSMQYEVGI